MLQFGSITVQKAGPPAPKLPWAPLLTPDEQRKGVTFYGGGARLRRVAATLVSGKPITVVTLGGSVTYGHGVEDLSLAYASLFFSFINASFPHRDHVFLNRGQPGATSQVTAPCVHSMVPQDADLVVLEFSANDSPTDWATSAKAGFEGMLRSLLRLPRAPAVVLLHHYPWLKANGDGRDVGLFYRDPEGQFTIFSNFYDAPSVSLRAAAWRLMQAGVEGFKVDKTILEGNRVGATGELIPAAEEQKRGEYFYLDTIHPSASGHQVLAELLAGLLTRAVTEVTTGTAPAERRDPRVEGLPPPMIPTYRESWPTLCIQLEEFEGMVQRRRGFEYRPEKPLLPRFEEQKWGWSADAPGAWAELEVDTRDRGGAGPPGADRTQAQPWVLLSHLRSYAGMGTATVECRSGCSCKPTVLDGTSASRATVFKIHSFKVSHHPRCRIRVTVSSEQGDVPQEGHKVMLSAVMVVHAVP